MVVTSALLAVFSLSSGCFFGGQDCPGNVPFALSVIIENADGSQLRVGGTVAAFKTIDGVWQRCVDGPGNSVCGERVAGTFMVRLQGSWFADMAKGPVRVASDHCGPIRKTVKFIVPDPPEELSAQ